MQKKTTENVAKLLKFCTLIGNLDRRIIAVASGFIAGTPPVDKTLSRTITKTILFLDWKTPSSWLVGTKHWVGYQSNSRHYVIREG